MPKKRFRFDAALDQHLADVLDFVLEPGEVRHALRAFAFLDEATAGKHQAMTAFILGYLYSDFNTYFQLVKERGPKPHEQEAFVEWLTEAVVPLVESALTKYETKKELR